MRSFMLLLSVLVLTACTAAPPAEEAVVDDTAQEEADIQELNRMLELWNEAAAAGDIDGILALVTDDYIRMEPDKPAIVGKDSFRKYLQSNFDKYSIESGQNVFEEIRLAGDWAYVRGSWSATLIPKDGGDPIQEISKWMGVWDRQADGSWKNSRGCGNLDAPLEVD